MDFQDEKIFSVSEINRILKDLIEGSFGQIVLEAEISNYKPNSSGHMYFKLKDSSSQISCVMFRSSAFYLKFKPKDGDKVRCTGRLSVYEPNGNYQFIISKMTLSGTGDILQMLEERKRALNAEGLFDAARKRPLPYFPNVVGVVTSSTGAAIHDILQIAKRRNPKISILVFPTLVQGEEAAFSIANQIKIANDFSLCDVLIVGRGGGSLEDLLPFSEEIVVRAVASSKIPVVSAVGHEIDWALCDYAADMRAPTPSAAAELVFPELSVIMQNLENYKSILKENANSKIRNVKLLLKQFSPENLILKFRSIEQPLLMRLDKAKEDLIENFEEKLRETKRKIDKYATILQEANPEAILKRGYSIVKIKSSGKIIRSSNEVVFGDQIEIIPSNGKINATVN